MVLIDGHNVLFALRKHAGRSLTPQAKATEAHSHARQLVELAASVVRSRAFGKRHVVLVCDGPPPPGIASEWPRAHADGASDGRVRLHFAGPGREADDALRDMLLHTLRPRDLLVVSSDRAVLRDATSVHARTMGTPDLLVLLSREPTSREAREEDDFQLSPAGIAAWLKFLEGPREPLTKKQKRRGR